MATRRTVTVDVCGHTATGRTKTEARENAMRDLTALVGRQHERVYRFGADGAIFCLYYTINGRGYDIFRPGYAHASSCFMSGTKERVLAAMEKHAATDSVVYASEHDSNGNA